jgi:DNA uptake protein ComE-like DNA-binding protein
VKKEMDDNAKIEKDSVNRRLEIEKEMKGEKKDLMKDVSHKVEKLKTIEKAIDDRYKKEGRSTKDAEALKAKELAKQAAEPEEKSLSKKETKSFTPKPKVEELKKIVSNMADASPAKSSFKKEKESIAVTGAMIPPPTKVDPLVEVFGAKAEVKKPAEKKPDAAKKEDKKAKEGFGKNPE